MNEFDQFLENPGIWDGVNESTAQEIHQANDISHPGQHPTQTIPGTWCGLPLVDQPTQEWEALLSERFPTFNGLLPSYQQADALYNEMLTLNNQSTRAGPQAVADFPLDDAGQKMLVGEIYHAIFDFSEIIDARHVDQATGASRKRKRGVSDVDENGLRENHQVRRTKSLSPVEAEILSWKILHCVRDAQFGRYQIAPWSQDWGRDRHFDTFRARLDSVLGALRYSKALVSGFLNSDLMRRVAAHPDKEVKRKTSNKAQNADRDAQVKAGIIALKSGKIAVDEHGMYGDHGNKIDNGQHVPPALVERMRHISTRDNKRPRLGNPVASRDAGYQRDLHFSSPARPTAIQVTTAGSATMTSPAFHSSPLAAAQRFGTQQHRPTSLHFPQPLLGATDTSPWFSGELAPGSNVDPNLWSSIGETLDQPDDRHGGAALGLPSVEPWTSVDNTNAPNMNLQPEMAGLPWEFQQLAAATYDEDLFAGLDLNTAQPAPFDEAAFPAVSPSAFLPQPGEQITDGSVPVGTAGSSNPSMGAAPAQLDNNSAFLAELTDEDFGALAREVAGYTLDADGNFVESDT